MEKKSTRIWQRALMFMTAAGLAGWLLSPVGATWLEPGAAREANPSPDKAGELAAHKGTTEGVEYGRTALPARMNGVSLTAPPQPVGAEVFEQLKTETAAGWVSVIPYAFCFASDPAVHFDVSRQWWGERSEGVVAQVRHARQHGMKVMIKPHVWVVHSGWIGEYGFDREEDWQRWEEAYQRYILRYARLADSLDAELFCISTETERAVRERPKFWDELIVKVREVYDGPLTYASNWDNFGNIPFWEQLDYIGINAYFPLLPTPEPSMEELKAAWQPHLEAVKAVQEKVGKPVLFTEYGYLSVPGSTWQTWKLENQLADLPADEVAQKQAYEALFQTFWPQEWFAGGFLWKWYLDKESRLHEHDRDYTPQGKAVLPLIREWYQGVP